MYDPADVALDAMDVKILRLLQVDCTLPVETPSAAAANEAIDALAHQG